MAQADRQFFRGFIHLHLLHHAAIAPIYGLEMMKELARHGYALSAGTLYPILHGLARAGYLKTSTQEHNGRMRRYYRITVKGRKALQESQAKIAELVKEVWWEQTPQSTIVRQEYRPSANGPGSGKKPDTRR